MKITGKMDKFIRLQRTTYKDAETAAAYEKDIQKDFDSIKNFLPENCGKILDIGCGIAGIDLFLSRHYKGIPQIYLFDYDKIDEEIYYGYRKRGSVYNSLSDSMEFLAMNGVDKGKIEARNVEGGFRLDQYDVIISLISYGFHYPIETYLREIKMCKAGIVILDLRKKSKVLDKKTLQIDLLKNNFDSVEVIADYQKHERILIK